MSLDLGEQYDRIYKYCYFKVKNKDTAEDLTQETFLKYFSQTTYINHGKLLAYLYTIAKNLCIDYFRKKVTASLDDDFADNDRISSFDTSLSIIQSVKSLPEDLQEIVLLRYANDLAIGEIASFMEISRFTVRRRLDVALKQLKSTLREEDFYE